jgi:hypothetical protein
VLILMATASVGMDKTPVFHINFEQPERAPGGCASVLQRC